MFLVSFSHFTFYPLPSLFTKQQLMIKMKPYMHWDHFYSSSSETTRSHSRLNIRWKEICQKIHVDPSLDKENKQQLQKVLECYQNVFAWNKGELGCYTIKEHSMDTQRFPPYKVSPGQLSYWEEAKVKKQIDVLVDLGKIKPNNFKYACHVTLPIKKDGSRCSVEIINHSTCRPVKTHFQFHLLTM